MYVVWKSTPESCFGPEYNGLIPCNALNLSQVPTEHGKRGSRKATNKRSLKKGEQALVDCLNHLGEGCDMALGEREEGERGGARVQRLRNGEGGVGGMRRGVSGDGRMEGSDE